MESNLKTKSDLLAAIEDKETQLQKAETESGAWNRGKYKNSSNANVSKVLVESLREELIQMKAELINMEKE